MTTSFILIMVAVLLGVVASLPPLPTVIVRHAATMLGHTIRRFVDATIDVIVYGIVIYAIMRCGVFAT